MTRAIRSLLLLLAAAAFAACGGSGGASPEPTDPGGTASPPPTAAPTDAAAPTPGTALDACEIVTPADIEAATAASGVDAGELKIDPTVLSPGHTTCTYEGAFGRLIVDLTPEDGENLYDAARGAYADASDSPVAGVGDGGFYSKQNHRGFYRKGTVAVMLTGFFAGEVGERDALDALGISALTKV